MTKKDYQNAKDKLFIRMGSAKNNAEYGKGAVCFPFCGDLMEIVLLSIEEGFVKVTYEMLRKWDVSPDQVHKDARMCMDKQGVYLFDLNPLTLSLMVAGQPAENLYSKTALPESLMYSLTNDEFYYGSYTITKKEVLQKIRIMLGRDYYILPSSVMEVMIVPEKPENVRSSNDIMKKVVEMNQAVKEINEQAVETEIRLSDEIFHFSLEFGLEPCTQYIHRMTSSQK